MVCLLAALRDGYSAGYLSLWLDIRGSGWYHGIDLPNVRDDHACLKALTDLWARADREVRQRAEIIRVGVTLADLTPASERQLDLFLNDDRRRLRYEILTDTIDRLNSKFGKQVVTVGPWIPPPGGYFGGKIAYNRIPSAEDFW